MSQFLVGVKIQCEELVQFKLPEDLVLIVRYAARMELILCRDKSDFPSDWERGSYQLKVFGTFEKIKLLFPVFKLPPESKVIGLSPGAIFQIQTSKNVVKFSGKRRKRVLIVDDSATIRKLLRHLITTYDGWEVVAEIENANEIPSTVEKFYPDLVTLDLHLGLIDGVEAMKRFLAPSKLPTILVTSQKKEDGGLVMDALSAGALDYLQKPESGQWESMKEELHIKMEIALKAKWQNTNQTVVKRSISYTNSFNPENFIVAIGSSTGGTQALQEILTRLPKNFPPIIISQHIPAGFSRALAERLNKLCQVEIKEAEDGDEIYPGRVLIAPGNHHLKLSKGGKTVEVVSSEPVNRFRPSVEVMFNSVQSNAKTQVVAIMLTGMGNDGAKAMLELHKKGAFTIAQDEASCVVFGMPREAIKMGGVDVVKNLNDIPETVIEYISQKVSLKIGT